MAAFSALVCSAAMMTRKSRGRAAATLALLVPLMGCQLVKKLTGRGNNDGGSRTTTAPLSDAGGASPVIALPNPTVAPLPTTPPPVPPPGNDGVGDGAVAAATDAAPSTPDDAPVVAVVAPRGRRGRTERAGRADAGAQTPAAPETGSNGVAIR
mgnify:CR=1 FL=1